MSDVCEVLSPWAEVDQITPEGLSPRLVDLSGKRIGLFANDKIAAAPILAVVEQELKKRHGDQIFSRFGRRINAEVAETEDRARFEKWIKEVDAVILAVGD